MGEQLYKTEKIISALKDTNGLVSLAARRLGCSPQTIYNRARTVKAVQQTIDECRDELVDHAELALRSAVLSKEAWAVALVLRTIGKKRGYGDRLENINLDVSALSDDQLSRLAAGEDLLHVLTRSSSR